MAMRGTVYNLPPGPQGLGGLVFEDLADSGCKAPRKIFRSKCMDF